MIIIAGPCVIESEESTDYIASKLNNIFENLNVEFYFKASFDKANRTSIGSYRGPGIDEGLRILNKIKRKYNLKIVTDVHETFQVGQVSEVADVIQIPAFLCRQTDLLVAAGKTGKIVNIKKGQFLAPWDMINVVNKIKTVSSNAIWLCERGTSFGYNNLIVDMTSFYEMKKTNCPIIFDATHSVQRPGGKGDSTSGNREYIETLANAAIATNIDGAFFEVHPNPEQALSDGANSIKLTEIERIVKNLLKIDEVVKNELQ